MLTWPKSTVPPPFVQIMTDIIKKPIQPTKTSPANQPEQAQPTNQNRPNQPTNKDKPNQPTTTGPTNQPKQAYLTESTSPTNQPQQAQPTNQNINIQVTGVYSNSTDYNKPKCSAIHSPNSTIKKPCQVISLFCIIPYRLSICVHLKWNSNPTIQPKQPYSSNRIICQFDRLE